MDSGMDIDVSRRRLLLAAGAISGAISGAVGGALGGAIVIPSTALAAANPTQPGDATGRLLRGQGTAPPCPACICNSVRTPRAR